MIIVAVSVLATYWWMKPRPPVYFHVTTEMLEGHILPTPGARVTTHDLVTQWIYDVCPVGQYDRKLNGPWIATHVH